MFGRCKDCKNSKISNTSSTETTWYRAWKTEKKPDQVKKGKCSR